MHNKLNRVDLNQKNDNLDELTIKSKLFNMKAKNQDILISHFQIYLINNGNQRDPKTYASIFKLLDSDGEYNYLAYLIADENELDIYYNGINYGRRNLLEAFFALRNNLRLDTKTKLLDDLLLYIFLHHDYLSSSIDIELNHQQLIVDYVATNTDPLLNNIFKAYGIELSNLDLNAYQQLSLSQTQARLDINTICDKIDI